MPVFNNVLAGSSGQTSGGGSAPPASDYTIQRSLRFDSSSSAYLSKTFSSAGNRQSWTWSGWVKQSKFSSGRQALFSGGTTANDSDWLEFGYENGNFYSVSNSILITSPNDFRDYSAWQHIVVTYNGSNLTFYSNGTQFHSGTRTGNLGINSAALHTIGKSSLATSREFDGYIADIHFIDAQALQPSNFGEYDTTTGVWKPKAFTGQHGTNGFHLKFANNSSNSALGTDSSGNNNTFTVYNLKASSAPTYSNNVTTNSGTSWFGGAAVNAFDGATNTFVQGAIGGDVTFAPSSPIAVGTTLRIWADSGSGFGVGNGPYTISYNGSSVYNSSMWSSPYTITAAAGTSLSSLAISPSGGEAMRLFAIEIDGTILVNGDGLEGDCLFDTPTNYDDGANVGGNYATWSPLVAQSSGSITLSNGNLDTTCGSTRTTAMSNFPLTGKSYWEVTFGSGTYNYIGMTEATGFNTVANNNSGIKYTGYKDYSYGWGQTDGKLYKASNIIASPGSYSNGDVMGWAYDADNNTLKLYKNGSLQHTETSIPDAQYFPAITHSGTATASTNFGQRPFQYPVSGYNSLCTTNLPDPGVADPQTVMGISLYNGSGATQTVGGPVYSNNVSAYLNALQSDPVTNLFDGNTSTGAKSSTTSGSGIKFVPSTAITGSIELFLRNGDTNNSTFSYSLDNGSTFTNLTTTGGSGSYVSIGSQTITNTNGIIVRHVTTAGTNDVNWRAIRVDNTVLTDGAGTPYKFSPELIWFKQRSGSSTSHALIDAVRGGHKRLVTNGTNTENDVVQYGGGVSAFNNNGFTLGTWTAINASSESYVAWAWDAENLASNSAYYQDQVWSDNLVLNSGASGSSVAQSAKKAFNGDTSSWYEISVGTGGQAIVDFNVSLTNVTSLEFFGGSGAAGTQSITVTGTGVNQTTITSMGSTKQSISLNSTTVSNLTFTVGGDNNFRLAGLYVNGKLLVDAGVIPVGGLNSSLYNQSQTWSNTLTSSPSNSLGNAANVFDGSESHGRNTNMSSGATVTFTPTGTITNVTKLEVKVGAVNTTNSVFELNGVNKLSDYNTLVGTSSAVTDRYVDITSLFGGSTTLTSMKWGYNGSSDYNLIRNIKVNGKLLVDSGVSLTNVPSIASTCRRNQSAGFSISTYTSPNNSGNQSFAHHLNAKPDFVVVKNRDSSYNWDIYHSSLGYNSSLIFTNYTTRSGAFSAEPDSSFVYTRNGYTHNGTDDYLALCWAAVEGYSAFGSYQGTGYGDDRAPFIWMGFKPALVMIKSSTLSHNWVMFDSTRGAYNAVDEILWANKGNDEGTVDTGDTNTGDLDFDILSNGIKLRTSNWSVNKGSSDTYIYCAWASNPFKHQSRAN